MTPADLKALVRRWERKGKGSWAGEDFALDPLDLARIASNAAYERAARFVVEANGAANIGPWSRSIIDGIRSMKHTPPPPRRAKRSEKR